MLKIIASLGKTDMPVACLSYFVIFLQPESFTRCQQKEHCFCSALFATKFALAGK